MSTIKAGTTSTTAYQVEADTTGNLVIATGASANVAMTVNSSGNIGIGTSSPAQRLDVTGAVNSVQARFGNVAGRGLTIGTTTNSGTNDAAVVFNAPTTEGAFLFQTVSDTKMALSTSGNLGLGTTSPGYKLDVRGVTASGNGTITTGFTYDTRGLVGTFSNHALGFITNGASPTMVLDTSGNLGVGSTSPGAKIEAVGVNSGATLGSGEQVIITRNTSTANGARGAAWRMCFGSSTDPSAQIDLINGATGQEGSMSFSTRNSSGTFAERARIDSLGRFMVGATDSSTSDTVAGVYLFPVGVVQGTRASNASGDFGRLVDDGDIVVFRQAGITEGSISVSGNTVSYNAFAGSHWSQLQDGSKPDILRGTVMESINELCEWPDETNERLPKAKISDTAGSKKVYGVFMAWDNDWTETNDMYVTAVGAFICRVNGSVTVQEGDLLESNGDGTARVQADDIIRSSTIGKVTSTVKTHQYDDGSYCVPAVLYCG